jgi:hypothetical protein
MTPSDRPYKALSHAPAPLNNHMQHHLIPLEQFINSNTLPLAANYTTTP